MSEGQLLERIDQLEHTLARVQHELERAQAVAEIKNLFARYAYYHTANLNNLIPGLFASKTPGVRVCIAELGTWEGPQAAERAWGVLSKWADPNPPGMMPVHALATPFIEVAGDGLTARGMWTGVGFVAVRSPEGKPSAFWEWDKYGIDFVKEDGVWKIWHHYFTNLFRTNWVGFGEDWDPQTWEQVPLYEKWEKAFGDFPEGTRPDGPGVNQAQYSINTRQQLQPEPPEPYQRWDESKRY
ncbi:nuclear transport factor 2 family protein [Pseudomonas japonica]|uniref:nuclear transport factor 2 family protein n=1 Tax=Pseudomonas TaxID=286 RepID=UPI002928F06D|nr:nuclear transport factor 2 family protein [Pseudomonas sp. zfem002]MDU9392864.1 nuclear transport factor 2 family protein [Pseudomonas sp. zfem002]